MRFSRQIRTAERPAHPPGVCRCIAAYLFYHNCFGIIQKQGLMYAQFTEPLLCKKPIYHRLPFSRKAQGSSDCRSGFVLIWLASINQHFWIERFQWNQRSRVTYFNGVEAKLKAAWSWSPSLFSCLQQRAAIALLIRPHGHTLMRFFFFKWLLFHYLILM